MRANDGQMQLLGQLPGATGVVNVGVGQPDLLQMQTQPGHFCQQQVQVTTGVDDGARAIVHNQKLVGLHRLSIFLDEVGEHVAGMVVLAKKFNGHVV